MLSYAAVVVAIAMLLAAVARLRGHSFSKLEIVVAVGAAAAFGVTLVAVGTDFQDADGLADCYPDCNGVQNAARVGFFIAPSVLIVLLLLAAVLPRRQGRRFPRLRGHGG